MLIKNSRKLKFIEIPNKYGDKYFLLCDTSLFIFVAAPVWPTQFELWKSGLVNLFEFIVPTAWYNRGLVIIADKYFTSLDVVKFLGERKISLVGPVMDVRIKRIFDKKYLDSILKKQNKKDFKRKVVVAEYELPNSEQKLHIHILHDKLSKKPIPFLVSNITLLNNEEKTNCTIEQLDNKKLAPIQKFYNSTMWPVDKVDQTLENYSLIYQYQDDHWFRHQMHTMVDWILQNSFSLYKDQVPKPKNKFDFLAEVAFDWIGRKEEDFGLFGVQSPPKKSKRYCYICSRPSRRTHLECIHCHKFACSEHTNSVRVCHNCFTT